MPSTTLSKSRSNTISPHLRQGVQCYNTGAKFYNTHEFASAESPLNKSLALFLHENDYDKLKMASELLSKAYMKQEKFMESAMILARLILLSPCKESELKKWHYSWKTKLAMGKLDNHPLFNVIRNYVKSKFKARQNGSLQQIFSLKNILCAEEKKFSPEQLFCRSTDVEHLNILLDLELICLSDVETYYRQENTFHKERQLILKQLTRDVFPNETEHPIRKCTYELELLLDEISTSNDYLFAAATSSNKLPSRKRKICHKSALLDEPSSQPESHVRSSESLLVSSSQEDHQSESTLGKKKMHAALLHMASQQQDDHPKYSSQTPSTPKDSYLSRLSHHLQILRQNSFQRDQHLQQYIAADTAVLYMVRSFILYNRHISSTQFKFEVKDSQGNYKSKEAYEQFILEYIQKDLQAHLQDLHSNLYKKIMSNFLYAITSLERMFSKHQSTDRPLWHYVRDSLLLSQYLFSMYNILDHFRQMDLQSRVLQLLKYLHYKDAQQLLEINLELSFLQIKVGNIQSSLTILEAVREKFFGSSTAEETFTKFSPHAVYLHRILYEYCRTSTLKEEHGDFQNLELLLKEIQDSKRPIHNRGHLYSLTKYFLADTLFRRQCKLHDALQHALSSLAYRSRGTCGQGDVGQLLMQPLSQQHGLLTNSMDYHLMTLSLHQVTKIYLTMGNVTYSEHFTLQGMILSLHTLSYSFLIDFMLTLSDLSKQTRQFDRCAQFMDLLNQFVEGFYSHAVNSSNHQQDDIFSLKQRVLFHSHFADYFLRQNKYYAPEIQKHLRAHLKKAKFCLDAMKNLRPLSTQLRSHSTKRTHSESKFKRRSSIHDKENQAPKTIVTTPATPLQNRTNHSTGKEPTLHDLKNYHLQEVLFLFYHISAQYYLFGKYEKSEASISKMPFLSRTDRALVQMLRGQLSCQLNNTSEAVKYFKESAQLIALESPIVSWKTYSHLSQLSLANHSCPNYASLSLGLQLRHQKIGLLHAFKKEIERKKEMGDERIVDIGKFLREVTRDEKRCKDHMDIFSADSFSASLETPHRVLPLLPEHFVVCSLALSPNFEHMTATRMTSNSGAQGNSTQFFSVPLIVKSDLIESRFAKLVERVYAPQELDTGKYAHLVHRNSSTADSLDNRVHTLYVALSELSSILSESSNLMQRIDEHMTSQQRKLDWWKAMFVLDKRMQTLISFMDTHLLGEQVKRSLFSDSSSSEEKTHFVLILDRFLNRLPWEHMPALRYASCSRLPSLLFLWSHLTDHYNGGEPRHDVHPESLSFILNPGTDLQSTQKRFEAYTNEEPASLYYDTWNGITNRSPSVSQFENSLSRHNIFLYMGHGAGEKYFSADRIRSMKCEELRVALLMGCSSGKLKERGDFEPEGTVLNYLVNGGCAMIVANLWDVSAHECDRFTFHLLSSMLQSATGKRDSSGDEKDHHHQFITEFLPAARESCRLKYLMGAAPVCFGLPLKMRKESSKAGKLNDSGMQDDSLNASNCSSVMGE